MHVVLRISLATLALVACDKPREILHDLTKPPGPQPAATPSVVVTVNVTVAAPDAGPPAAKPKTAVAPAPAPAPPKKSKQEPLNGLPAGAVCIQGSQGNGGCASGSECENGKCTCYNGWTSCSGACRDLSRDPYNCDKCGKECEYGQYCRWGHCER
jgi:hypothetical protein